MAQIIHEACRYLQQRHPSGILMMPCGSSSLLSTSLGWCVQLCRTGILPVVIVVCMHLPWMAFTWFTTQPFLMTLNLLLQPVISCCGITCSGWACWAAAGTMVLHWLDGRRQYQRCFGLLLEWQFERLLEHGVGPYDWWYFLCWSDVFVVLGYMDYYWYGVMTAWGGMTCGAATAGRAGTTSTISGSGMSGTSLFSGGFRL